MQVVPSNAVRNNVILLRHAFCHSPVMVGSEMLACTAMDTVGSAAMPGNVAGIVKVVSQVRGIAQLLCCAGAAHRGIEGPLPHQTTIFCMRSNMT